MFYYFKKYLNLFVFKIIYRMKNKNNFTTPLNCFDINHVKVNRLSYGGINIIDYSLSNNKLYIGAYCSIGPGVVFLLGGEHNLDTLTTYPMKVKILGYEFEGKSKGNIIVHDDVWIGANVVICSGISVGQGAVVAAGSVVTKDVPPYSIVGGNPAKIIRYRFSEYLIKTLLEIDIVKLYDKCNVNNISSFYKKINDKNINDIINEIEL